LFNYNKVLIVGPNYKRRKGGIASVLAIYASCLREDFKFCPSIYFQNIYLSILFFPINLVSICVKLLTDRSIKIVHIHGSHSGSFIRKYIIFLFVKFVFYKKVIYHIHSSHFHKFYNNSTKFYQSYINKFISNADILIVLSEEWEDYFIKNFNTKKIIVLENVVSKPAKTSNNSIQNKIKLLFLGRIGERKGVFDLVQTMINYRDRLDVELFIGGDGDVVKLKQMLKKHNLQNIKFLGWVNGDEKTKLLQNTNIFILPSYDEGLPISILEAMSFKKAIISTHVGGIPRIVKDNVNGFIVTPGHQKQIFEAINHYILKPKLLIKHGNKSYEIVSDYFVDSVIYKLNNIYSYLL
jgi:glycosyltransferase involved in cell wall biosynthesis